MTKYSVEQRCSGGKWVIRFSDTFNGETRTGICGGHRTRKYAYSTKESAQAQAAEWQRAEVDLARDTGASAEGAS